MPPHRLRAFWRGRSLDDLVTDSRPHRCATRAHALHMTDLDSLLFRFPRFGDVAHVGHLELLTPKPEESLAFFTARRRTPRERACGRFGLPARLGRLRVALAEADGAQHVGRRPLGLRVRNEARCNVTSPGSSPIRFRAVGRGHRARPGVPLRDARRPRGRAVLGDTALHRDTRGLDRLQEPAAALRPARHRAAPARPRQHPRAGRARDAAASFTSCSDCG